MALAKPRTGKYNDFQIFPNTSKILTLGDPEKLIWSSIKHLCAEGIIHELLKDTYGVKDKKQRSSMAFNIKLYINHAVEFYDVAKFAKPNTSPLFYYYSFLNLAKALCEIKYPNLHKMNESRRHGIRWTPSSDYLVNIFTENVQLTARGVWHLLWEAIVNRPCNIGQPLSLQVKDLLGLCPEISDEFERTLGEDSKLIDLINPGIIVNQSDYEIWLRFSVSREELKNYHLSGSKFLQLIQNDSSIYYQIKSEVNNVWTFEFRNPKKFDKKIKKGLFLILEKEIKELNIFSSLSKEGLNYSIPIQLNIPIILPQIIVLYTLLFWLGSIVRYDPHSVADLQESEYWILIDGFISQSRVWLLELFEWEFYKWETTLQSAR